MYNMLGSFYNPLLRYLRGCINCNNNDATVNILSVVHLYKQQRILDFILRPLCLQRKNSSYLGVFVMMV